MAHPRPTLEFRRGDVLVAHVVVSPEAVWFQGHFPGTPLLPGVAFLALVEEALALFWSDAAGPPVEIRSFRRVRFRQPVEPGANLRIRAHRVEGERFRFSVEAGGLAACTGECTVIESIDMGTLKGFPYPPAMVRGEQSSPAPHAAADPLLADVFPSPWAMRTGHSEAAFCSDGSRFATVASRAAGLCGLVASGRLCVACEDRVDVAAAVLAALAGRIEVVFPPALTPEALVATHAARPFSHWLGPAEWQSHVAGLSCTRIDAASVSANASHLAFADLDIARIFLQTGGTTGQPRVWAKTARNLLGEIVAHMRALQVEPGDHILATVPPHHIYGLLFSVLLPLYSGATVERVSPFFPREIAERIEKTSATILVSTPAHLRALAAAPLSGHRLRLVLSSGALLPAADAASYFAQTGLWPLEVYGSTETGGIAVRRQDVPKSAWAPLPGVSCRMQGEVLAVRSAYVSGDAPRDGDGFFRTADLARIRPDASFDLLGRDDGVVKVGGQRVTLPEIEKALLSLEQVLGAVVLAVPSQSGRGQEIVALVASRRPADEIIRELRAQLPPPSWPRRLRCVEAIPTTPTGKRDRVAILQILHAATRELPDH
jgi:acyl-CoA synthetase (AMP-forming)/AMP-acid ligase II/3-hydroxymyristoyl/3-hydroxydecanoyl-(acyl carrier protein) dehydratase